MRILILAAVTFGCLATGAVAQQAGQQPGQGQAPPAPDLKSTKQKGSYGIGLSIGNNLKRAGFDLDFTLLVRGMTDALNGAKPALAPEEIQTSIQAFQQESVAKVAEKNKQESAAFFAQNKTKEGVTTRPSGLQIKVLKSGDGKVSPKATDTVTTHYKGTLLDGTVFDSSYQRNEPAQFAVNQVIAGWTEALQLMKVGDKWLLFIPGELAYGANGNPQGGIGPNAPLIFEIELLAIAPAKQ